MAVFEYRALQPDGSLTGGRLDADSRQEAMLQIERRGWTAVSVAQSATMTGRRDASTPAGPSWLKPRVPFAVLEDFTRSLSSLLAAGVPLSRALTILYKETTHRAASAKWKELHDLVIDGVSLADAMDRSPDVFSRVYVAMVESGETGGFLDLVLAQIADFQSREKELKAKVASAMIYPAVLLVLSIGVLIFLLVFFIPRFQVLLDDFGGRLPPITRAIVGTSEILRNYGLLVLMGVFAIGTLVRRWLLTDRGRRAWEGFVLSAPLAGPLVAKVAMSRFCRMLGSLLKAGVPLLNGLRVARRSMGYQTLIDLVSSATDRVQKGETLSASLADCRRLFGGSTLEMISVAEESGRLDQELIRQADVTEQVLDRNLRTTVALAEPLLLFLIAGLIGVIFVGMVIPIFTIQDYLT